MTELLRTLRGALVGALRRRGLWQAPPHFLGVIGHPSWTDRRTATTSPLDGALGELVADCYVAIFVRRQDRLTAQLRVKPNVDGIVFLNIRHFLHDRQRKHDPIGYRIFQILRSSLRVMQTSGLLHVLDGPVTISNTSTLGFTGHTQVARRAPRGLQPLVEHWADALTPAIADMRPKSRPEVVSALVRRLERLPDAGIEGFRVGDLAQALQRSIRARWHARGYDGSPTGYERLDGDRVRVGLTAPSSRFEDREALRQLADEVTGRIDDLAVRAKTRRHLHTLWSYLGAFADDRHEAGSLNVSTSEALPSHRQLGAQLGIPRERLPELFATLRRITNDVRQTSDRTTRDRQRLLGSA